MAEEAEKDERTEAATPRRRQEAREKGQVPLSTELIASLTLLAGFGALAMGGGRLATSIGGLAAKSFTDLGAVGTAPVDPGSVAKLFDGIAGSIAGPAAFVILPLLIVGLLAGFGQIGFQIAPKALAIDGARLNPIKGLERLFSARSAVRTLSAILKVTLVAGVLAGVAIHDLPRVAGLVGGDLGPVMVAVGKLVLRAAIGALVVILALGLFDLAFQRFQHEKDLRMTKKEVKEEHKSNEGDPHVRGRIRAIQRELASRRMMQEVPKATVVVTNPTHVAVALRYDRDEAPSRAPIVVAKGLDEIAQRIKEVAGEAGVPLFEDVPLARALHARTEIGDEVPVDLYEAVAAVLAYVYRVRGDARPVGGRA